MPTLTPKVFIERLNAGTDWSGTWSLVWECGTHAILKKSPGQMWAGTGRPRRYVPTRHALVSLEDQGYSGSALLRQCALMASCSGKLNPRMLDEWKAHALVKMRTADVAKVALELAGARLTPQTGTAEAVARVVEAAEHGKPQKFDCCHSAMVEASDRRAIPTTPTSETWVNPALVSDADLIAEVQRRNLVIPDPARGGA